MSSLPDLIGGLIGEIEVEKVIDLIIPVGGMIGREEGK